MTQCSCIAYLLKHLVKHRTKMSEASTCDSTLRPSSTDQGITLHYDLKYSLPVY